jgi:hypothetical protein
VPLERSYILTQNETFKLLANNQTLRKEEKDHGSYAKELAGAEMPGGVEASYSSKYNWIYLLHMGYVPWR